MLSTIINTTDPWVLVIATAAITTLINAFVYEWMRAEDLVNEGIHILRQEQVHMPVVHNGVRLVCACGDFNCASLELTLDQHFDSAVKDPAQSLPDLA